MSIDIVPLSIFVLTAMVVLLLSGLPIAFATGTIACIVALVVWGPGSLEIVLNIVTGFMKSYIFIAGPMFILMANFLEKSGVVEDLFHAVRVWFGPVGGGMAIATIVAGTIMAATTGIIGGVVVTLTLIALPIMLRHGYNKSIALGSIMAGADLGTLIPPSIVFIVYGFVSGASIGQLFIGGIIPGIMLSIFYCLYILIRAVIDPKVAPPLSKEERQIPLRQKLVMARGLILPVILIILILGSIYGGFATPTEAGAVGSLGALFCAAAYRKLNWKMLKESVFVTTEATCMMSWIAFGSLTLAAVYGLAGGTEFIKRLMVALPLSPLALIFSMQLILLFLGFILDWLGILFLTIPLFAPVVTALGFDLVWFGVLFVINIQMAYLTPPFAQSVFYVKGVAPPEISMGDLYKSVWAFVAIIFVTLLLVLFFPQIALWLPGQMLAK